MRTAVAPDPSGWFLREGAAAAAVDAALAETGHDLPSDYRAFLCNHNGGEGFIGENYLIVWSAHEVASFNRDYEVEKYAPGLVLFGSNGAGEAYGFDMRDTSKPVVTVPFIGMSLHHVEPMAAEFSDLFDAKNAKT